MSPNIRKYSGYKMVKNTVLDYVEGGVTTHSAREIADAHDLNHKSIRIAAKYLGITLKPGKRGGLRTPCNQHAKAK